MKLKPFLPLIAATAFSLPVALTSAQTTGVSHPENLDDPIDATTQQMPPSQKPSPAVPINASKPAAQSPSQAAETYSDTYIPSTPTLQTRSTTQAIATGDHYVPLTHAAFDPDDINSGIVTDVPTGPNELPIGTRITAQLNNTISTRETSAGTIFIAVLQAPVMHQDRILIPAGSTVQGRITQIHGGRRIGGASAVRLQPDTLVLPDHTFFRLDAEVVELDHFRGSHINREGVITNNGSGKTTAAILGGTTATAAIAGAVIGGGVGAVVGAGIGAGVSTVWWLRQDHQQTLPSGTEIVFGLNEPLVIKPAS